MIDPINKIFQLSLQRFLAIFLVSTPPKTDRTVCLYDNMIVARGEGGKSRSIRSTNLMVCVCVRVITKRGVVVNFVRTT